MLRYAIFPLLFFTALLPGRANLGDTVKECVNRYGKPVGYNEASNKSPFGTIVFESQGYLLVLFILDGKEVGARISRIDKTALSDADQQTMMATDEGGSQWISVKSDDPSSLAWQRGDQAKVIYDKDKHMLIFTSIEMSQALH